MISGEAGYRSLYLSHAKRALYHLSYIPRTTTYALYHHQYKAAPTHNTPMQNSTSQTRVAPLDCLNTPLHPIASTAHTLIHRFAALRALQQALPVRQSARLLQLSPATQTVSPYDASASLCREHSRAASPNQGAASGLVDTNETTAKTMTKQAKSKNG
jgi:hypothetical protein